MSHQGESQPSDKVPQLCPDDDSCVPEDILEHICPDEFQITEPSIAASWDDEARPRLHSPGAHDGRLPGSACTKRSTSSRQSQPHRNTPQNALALSSSASSGARATPPDLPPVAGRAMSLRGSEEEGSSLSPGGSRYPFSPGSPDKVLYAKMSGEDLHTAKSMWTTPPVAHQITFGDVELPEINEVNSAKRRRQQAAYTNKFGPAPPTANIRPVSANPTPCQLNAAMMIDACGVDIPREVEEIALTDRGISSIEIGELPAFSALKALNLENNSIANIAPLGRLESLMQLHVACNRIQSLPQLSSGLFFQLQVLDVGFNQIPVSEVFARESDWSRLPSLRKLDMSGNHLSQLPDAIGSFPSLKHLTLEYNQLSGESLRPLGRLPKLEVLGLANNHVDDIPMEAFTSSSFNSLTVLDMSRNRIRKPETLKVLQQVRNGTTVYIGDNPIARKMRLHLVQPKAIPGSRPGTVSISEDAREPATTTVIAEGMASPVGNNEIVEAESAMPQLTNTAGGYTVDPLSNSSTSSVFVKMMRYTPERPMLAKSLLDGILQVRKSMSKDQQGLWKMDENAGERLLAVFDELNVDIDRWREMETVPEGHECAEVSLAGELSAADRHSQSLQHGVEGEVLPRASEVETLLQQAGEIEQDFPELSDPTERVSARLGLDYKLLSHFTGLLGTDVNGAVARLRFMLAHSGCSGHLGATKLPNHQTLTTSAANKQRAKKQPYNLVLTVPTPPSKHEQQVETIQSALQGMQTKLAQVHKDIGEQLARYEYLVGDKTERSMMSTPVHEPSHPGTVNIGEERSVEQGAELMAAGDSNPVPTGDCVARADASTPDATCPGTDNELTTCFKKQEQGHQHGVMQAAVETEALGYT